LVFDCLPRRSWWHAGGKWIRYGAYFNIGYSLLAKYPSFSPRRLLPEFSFGLRISILVILLCLPVFWCLPNRVLRLFLILPRVPKGEREGIWFSNSRDRQL
jgi:hypothetical protein